MGINHALALWSHSTDQAHRSCTAALNCLPHLLPWAPTQRRKWGNEAWGAASEWAPTRRGRVGNMGCPCNTCGPDPPNYAKAPNCSSYPNRNIQYSPDEAVIQFFSMTLCPVSRNRSQLYRQKSWSSTFYRNLGVVHFLNFSLGLILQEFRDYPSNSS